MLVQFSEQVFTDLSASTALKNLLTHGARSIRPLLANYEDGDAIVVYYVQMRNPATKGGVYDWELVVQSWATSYDESIAIADAVATAIGNSVNYYKYISAAPKVSEQGILYTEQIFEIKK